VALNDFGTNDPFVNDCVFTLLRHVGVYRGRADLLCDPAILRPLGKIWEEGFNVCSFHYHFTCLKTHYYDLFFRFAKSGMI
jgi:timeless protein